MPEIIILIFSHDQQLRYTISLAELCHVPKLRIFDAHLTYYLSHICCSLVPLNGQLQALRPCIVIGELVESLSTIGSCHHVYHLIIPLVSKLDSIVSNRGDYFIPLFL